MKKIIGIDAVDWDCESFDCAVVTVICDDGTYDIAITKGICIEVGDEFDVEQNKLVLDTHKIDC